MKALESHPISVVGIFSARFKFHGDEREGRHCDLENQLLRVLDSGSWFAKEQACVALQALTFSKENATAIGSRGGVLSLLEICQAGTPSSQAFAVGVLRNLDVLSEIRKNFVEESGVFVLLICAIRYFGNLS
jgi:hypothetical protein